MDIDIVLQGDALTVLKTGSYILITRIIPQKRTCVKYIITQTKMFGGAED